ncbi:site-specific integrase, partial [Burkholderia cenocepacia]|uniref:site-specific integrase n=1 Tax=Burkholderia cenocepacia TaxID=95486 RepID=UPI0038CC120B
AQPLPAPVAVSVPAAPEKPTTGVSSTLADAVREWARLRSPDSSSIEKAELYVSRFHQVNGRLPLAGIKKEHGKRLVEHLVSSGLGHGTISNHVGILRAVMSSAVEAELIKASPFADLKAPAAPAKTPRKARIAFAVEDVRTILANLPDSGADRWIPLIGLYSGMRLEEIGQLAPDDVREETYRDAGGEARKTHVIYVTDEGEGQGIKNRKSRRRVPVHPELVRLGFLDLVKNATGSRVFSELRPDRHGREASSFGANFGRTFLRKTCGITDTRKTFHSFRHLFKDTMREAGVHEQVSDAITGHTTGTESRNYGDDFYPLRPLVEAINLFQLHGL